MNEDHAINRAAWDELAAVHGQDAYYDSEALVAGESSLIEEEEDALLAALQRITGRRILHVQCHLGFDAITFARRRAHVTGVDFSPVAIRKAKALSERCGVDVEWLCADVTDLPKALHGKFDLAWATIGILCWISDVRAWMRSVAETLARGGQLVLMDAHPLDGVEARGTAAEGMRRLYERGWDYATPFRTGRQVQFTHRLRDVVEAASDAGLRVTQVREHVDVSHGLCIEHLERESDGRFRRRVAGQPRPVLFTLRAVREEHRPPQI